MAAPITEGFDDLRLRDAKLFFRLIEAAPYLIALPASGERSLEFPRKPYELAHACDVVLQGLSERLGTLRGDAIVGFAIH